MISRRAFFLTAGAFFGAAGAGGWALWRRWQAFNLYRAAGDATPLPPTERHVRAIRRLRFAWDPLTESGGPIVDPRAPYGSARLADDLVPLAGTSDVVGIAAFHVEVGRALTWALAHGDLDEGRYAVPPLTPAVMRDLVRREAAHLPPPRLDAILRDLPALAEGDAFSVLPAHRLLLKKLAFGWPDAYALDAAIARGWQPVPTVHFKRPFGDASDVEHDIAFILGEPPPTDETRPRFWRLYLDMWPALQAFVLHARIPVAASDR